MDTDIYLEKRNIYFGTRRYMLNLLLIGIVLICIFIKFYESKKVSSSMSKLKLHFSEIDVDMRKSHFYTTKL
jgi:hypothetical protein